MESDLEDNEKSQFNLEYSKIFNEYNNTKKKRHNFLLLKKQVEDIYQNIINI